MDEILVLGALASTAAGGSWWMWRRGALDGDTVSRFLSSRSEPSLRQLSEAIGRQTQRPIDTSLGQGDDALVPEMFRVEMHPDDITTCRRGIVPLTRSLEERHERRGAIGVPVRLRFEPDPTVARGRPRVFPLWSQDATPIGVGQDLDVAGFGRSAAASVLRCVEDGRDWTVHTSISVGRGDWHDIVLPELSASRWGAKVDRAGLVTNHPQSSVAILVDGAPVPPGDRRQIREGDLRIGETNFVFAPAGRRSASA